MYVNNIGGKYRQCPTLPIYMLNLTRETVGESRVSGYGMQLLDHPCRIRMGDEGKTISTV